MAIYEFKCNVCNSVETLKCSPARYAEHAVRYEGEPCMSCNMRVDKENPKRTRGKLHRLYKPIPHNWK